MSTPGQVDPLLLMAIGTHWVLHITFKVGHDRAVLTLDARIVVELPVDELALRVLADIHATGAWNEHNYLVEAAAEPAFRASRDAQQAIAEAMGWLRSRGLIGRKADDSSGNGIFVTRAGRGALNCGLARVRAAHRLQEGLHPRIEAVGRRQFLLGEYEQAIFVAMKGVEVRVRELAGLSEDAIGVDLMNKAFGPTGPLTDPSAVKGERDGTRALFAGAYAVLRNPSGHREIDYDDVAEAAEAVTTASLLMRILDRVEHRLS